MSQLQSGRDGDRPAEWWWFVLRACYYEQKYQYPPCLSVAMLYVVFRTYIHLKALSLPVILSGRRAL